MSTEQEQEALVAAYLEEHGHHADARHGFLAGLAAGFRRSEVPEPSGRMIDTYDDSELRTAFGLPEQQGEPSSEVLEPSTEPTCICPNTLGWHTTECVASRPEPETAEAQAYSKGFTEGSDQAHRDMQGDPSDAQVLDAQNSMGRGGYWVPEEQVRAALRAAGVVGQEGESR